MNETISGILERIKGGYALRDDKIVGWTKRLPVKGGKFSLSAPARDAETGLRYVITSEVVEVLDDGVFRTKSDSMYRFTPTGSTDCV